LTETFVENLFTAIRLCHYSPLRSNTRRSWSTKRWCFNLLQQWQTRSILMSLSVHKIQKDFSVGHF